MARPIDIQEPPACTTPEGTRQLEQFMHEMAQRLVNLGGDPLRVSPGGDYDSTKR